MKRNFSFEEVQCKHYLFAFGGGTTPLILVNPTSKEVLQVLLKNHEEEISKWKIENERLTKALVIFWIPESSLGSLTQMGSI